MKTEEELFDLKKEVETAKTKSAELNGQKKNYLKQLKDEWSFKSTEEGDKKITELLAKIREIDAQIKENSTKLEEEYNV